MAWNSANCYNIAHAEPLNEKKMTIFQYEWKSHTLSRLYFAGDVSETTFKRALKENHGDALQAFQAMECRLDTLMFRSMFAPSVFCGRKMVSEGRVRVNGEIVKMPDYRLRVGEIAEVDVESREMVYKLAKHPMIRLWSFLPPYLEVDFKHLMTSLIRKPGIDEIPCPYPRSVLDNTAMFYSKRN